VKIVDSMAIFRGCGRVRTQPSRSRPRRGQLAFLVHVAGRVLHAKANALLVYIQSDEVHNL